MRKLPWIFLFCLAACAPAIAGPAKPDGASVAPPPALARAWQAQIATGPNLVLSMDSSGAVKVATTGACSGNGNVGTWANLTFQTDSSGNLKTCGTGSVSDAFSSLIVSGQTTVVASGSTALTVVAGANVTLTTNNTTKTLQIDAGGGGTGCNTSGSTLLKGDGAGGCANVTSSTVTGANVALGGTLNVSGHVTFESVTSTGATGTGKLVFDTAPTISGHPTVEGVTSTGATGTGKFAFDHSPTFVTPNLGVPSAVDLTNATAVPAGQVVGVIPIANLATGTPTGSKFIRDDGTLAVPPGGGGGSTPQILGAYVSKTGSYTLNLGTDGTVECKTNACTFTLPTAVGIAGQGAALLNQQVSNLITVNTTSGQTFNGAASGATTFANSCQIAVSDGANWVLAGSCGFPISGTINSGGIPYFTSSAGAAASSATLVANAVMLGGGSGAAPATTTTGTGVVTGIGNAVNAAGGFVTTDGTASLSSKTYVQLPTPMTYIAGVSQAGTASVACNLPSSGAATAVSASSTTPPLGVMSFSGSAQNDVHCMGITPADWTASSAMDVTLFWRSASTSGNVVWSIATLFAGDGTALNGSYNTASTATDTAKGTTLQVNTVTLTGVTATGIGASKLFFIDIGRNGGSGSDTMSGTAELIGFIVTIRRSPVGGS